MDTNRLRQFCAIAELGSMTKASKLLHITHSGLSKSMKLLQEELGLVLLRPLGRGLALTRDGVLIFQRAKEFLEQEARLFKITNIQPQANWRIGAVEIFLLSMTRQLKCSPFENGHITLLDLDPGNIEQLIANGQLDFGITYVPFPNADVDIIEIGNYSLGCYYLNGAFNGMKISEIPFVTPARGLSPNPLDIKERDGWVESAHPRTKKYSVNLLATAIELTLEGLCAIYIPDFIARRLNASCRSKKILTEYPLPKNQKNVQTAFLLKHKDHAEDAIFNNLCKSLKALITLES